MQNQLLNDHVLCVKIMNGYTNIHSNTYVLIPNFNFTIKYRCCQILSTENPDIKEMAYEQMGAGI